MMSFARWWHGWRYGTRSRRNAWRNSAQLGPFETLETRVLLAAGALDTSFGGSGVVFSTFTGGQDFGKAIAVQADGKIVIAGTVPGPTGNSNTTSDFAVARYNTDGSADTTFAGIGRVRTDVFQFDNAFDILVQSDGKIVVVGEMFNGVNFDFAIARYNTNGSLDTSFASVGVTTYNFGFGNDSAQSVAIQSDGKLVVAGTMFNGTNLDFALIRLNGDGSLDGSFGLSGRSNTGIGAGDDVATKVQVLADGRIFVAGEAVDVTGFRQGAMVMYTSGAGIDTSYGLNGLTTLVFGNGNMSLTGLRIDPLGRTLVSGTYAVNGDNNFWVARLNGNGSLDTSFAGFGFATVNFGSISDFAFGMTVQGDSSVVVVGSTVVAGETRFAIARYLPSGALDNNFGGGGLVITEVGPADSQARGVAMQSDGNIVVVGHTTVLAVARYQGNITFPQGDPNTITKMFRAYNTTADYHFFTTSFVEFANAVNAGYRDETSGRASFGVRAGQFAGTTAVHRLYNPNTGRHYYTASDGEKNNLVGRGWVWEKDEGYIFPTQASGTTEIFRLYNRNSGVHLYTESSAIKDDILTRFPNDWSQHTSLGFAYALAPGAAVKEESTAPAVMEVANPQAEENSGGDNVDASVVTLIDTGDTMVNLPDVPMMTAPPTDDDDVPLEIDDVFIDFAPDEFDTL